jgi:hypothetical protein
MVHSSTNAHPKPENDTMLDQVISIEPVIEMTNSLASTVV